MDYPKDIVIINLNDRDGIIVGGTTYKLANGSNILLRCTKYPTITFDNHINTQENMAIPVTATQTLSSTLGPVKFSGNVRPIIVADIVLTVSNAVPTRTEYAAMTGKTELSFYLLYNMWRYPHRMYLKDMVQSTDTVLDYPNLDLPINILMSSGSCVMPAIDRTDLLGQQIFSSYGVPVILKSISLKNEYITNNKDTLQDEAHFEYTLTFVVDNYGT